MTDFVSLSLIICVPHSPDMCVALLHHHLVSPLGAVPEWLRSEQMESTRDSSRELGKRLSTVYDAATIKIGEPLL